MSARATTALAALLLGSCVLQDVDLSGLPCPCAGADYVCDVATNSCIRLVSGPFSLRTTPSAVTIRQGRSAMLTVELVSDIAQSVSITAVGLPNGVVASPLLLTGKHPSGELLLTTDTSAPISSSAVQLEGTGPTGQKMTQAFTLSIDPRPGTLDPSFGDKGVVTVPGIDGSVFPRIVVTPDDRSVIVLSGNAGCYLVRLLPTGVLDPSFGTGGITVTPRATLSDPAWQPSDLVLQPDGKIIVVGQTNPATAGMLWRFDATGHLDPTFGTGGRVAVSLGAAINVVSSVALRPDGRIVLVAYTGDTFDTVHVAVLRYNTDGTRDTSFGTGGQTKTMFASQSETAGGVLLLSDQRIVIAGARHAMPPRGLLVRFTADGALDSGFASNGLLEGDPMTAFSTVIDGGDGAVLVGGAFTDGNVLSAGQGAFVRRVLASGGPDASFGVAGTSSVTTQPMSTSVVSLVATASNVAVFDQTFFTEMDAHGAPDTQLGLVTAPMPMTFTDATLAPSGRLVAVGGVFGGKLQVARYWP